MSYTGKQLKAFERSLRNLRAVVYDQDNTIVNGRTAELMGMSFLMSEEEKGRELRGSEGQRHRETYEHGRANIENVLAVTENEGEAAGLELFYEIIGHTGCADKRAFYALTQDAITANMLPGLRNFVTYMKQRRMEQYISSVGASIGVDAAVKYLGLDGGIGNPVFYHDPDARNPIIKGCKPTLRDAADKFYVTESMLNSKGLSLPECLVVGNDELDHILFQAAGLALAPGSAKDETKQLVEERGGLVLPDDDFAKFTRDLKSYASD